MDHNPRPDYPHVYHNGSRPGGGQRRPGRPRTPEPIDDDDPPRRFALCDAPETEPFDIAGVGEGPLYADLDGWHHYDIDPATIVGWGMEFNDLAIVCLRCHEPRQRIYGRFSSAEGARALYSRIAPLRVVYG